MKQLASHPDLDDSIEYYYLSMNLVSSLMQERGVHILTADRMFDSWRNAYNDILTYYYDARKTKHTI